jgi:hypothetical protein
MQLPGSSLGGATANLFGGTGTGTGTCTNTADILPGSSCLLLPHSSSSSSSSSSFGVDKASATTTKHVSSLGGQYGFFHHVFDTSDASKGEILNLCQYALLALVPVVLLNKLMARMIPDPDPDASSIELIAEIVMQMVLVLCGIILIHRVVTYVPTWSQFRYEPLVLTNSVIVFMVIVLSLNTKLGLKCSMLYDRTMDYLGLGGRDDDDNGGNSGSERKRYRGSGSESGSGSGAHHHHHYGSQADSSSVGGITPLFLPPPTPSGGGGGSRAAQGMAEFFGPAAASSGGAAVGLQSANALLGSAFS